MKAAICFVFFCLAASLAAAADAVKLPSFEIHPKWREWFPSDKPFFAEKTPEGGLAGMHVRYQSRLEGASVTLHDNGKLKSLAYYPGGSRQGSYRVWDEDGALLFFGQFKDGKPQGVLCMFTDDDPCFVQRWEAGAIASETLVTRSGSTMVSVNDPAALERARNEMVAMRKGIDREESALRVRLREWAAKQKEGVDEAQMKTIRAAGTAKLETDIQRARQEADARLAAAHTYRNGEKDRKGRVAATDARLAAQDRKKEQRKGAAVVGEDKRKAGNLAARQEGDMLDLYVFAVAALEAAMPGEGSNLRPIGSSAPRTYLVTYQTAGKKPTVHTEAIVAASREDARAKLRANHPQAKIQKIAEK